MIQLHDAAISALQATVKQLQSGLEEARARATAAEAAAAAQRELALQLAHALEAIKSQGGWVQYCMVICLSAACEMLATFPL